MAKAFCSRKPVIYIIAGAALLIALLAVYSPLFTGHTEFNGDDFTYILENPVVRDPSAEKILLSPTRFEFFPVTIASFAIEYPLWGEDPRGYRFVNLFLFILICLGAFSITRRLVKADEDGLRSCAMALGAVFVLALHPANVESIASISSRKELLYAFFGLISLRLYLAEGGLKTYGPALVFLILAQLSKGTGVVLPLLFTVYEVFHVKKGAIKRLLPFYVVSGIIFFYQMSVAKAAGVVGGWEGASILERLGAVALTISRAVSSLLFPMGLSLEYDLRMSSVASADWIIPGLLALAFVYLFYKKREALFLLLVAAIPFLPYSNIVPLRHTLPSNIVYYDHYLLFSIMAAGPLLAYFASSVKTKLKYIVPLAAGITAFFVVQDYRFSELWKTRESLYLYNIKKAPSLAKSYYFLGHAYLDHERYSEALAFFEKADSLGQEPPGNYYLWLGNACAFTEKYENAATAYTRFLAANPENRAVLQNLSSALMMLGKYDEAEKTIERLLSYYPNDPDALANLKVIRAARAGK